MTASETFSLSPKLRVKDLRLIFPDLETPVLKGLSFEADPGTLTVITGANASGKSCVIHSLCGIIPQSIPADLSGEISFGDIDLKKVPLCETYQHMSVALCDASMQLFFPSCELELAFALENRGMQPSIIRSRIDASLKRFGLDPLIFECPQKLSGGEQRLLIFAICESLQNPILLLDEPETGLSHGSMSILTDWLRELRQRGVISFIATHNEEIIALADKEIRLSSV